MIEAFWFLFGVVFLGEFFLASGIHCVCVCVRMCVCVCAFLRSFGVSTGEKKHFNK